MKFEIRNRWNDSVIFEVEADSFIKAVEQKYADLRGADLRDANLMGAYLTVANLTGANLKGANLKGTNLTNAYLTGAYLTGANLTGANLTGAYLTNAYLTNANLMGADLRDAYLTNANLTGANLTNANLKGADLTGADLRGADLMDANLTDAYLKGARNMVKTIGIEQGNFYWKRFNLGLVNNGYQFYVGLNILREGEVFASDDRQTCSYPGFHFASRSWCNAYYGDRPLEARIRIPEDAQINEPWATDGKASADKIEIIQVSDAATGEDVTDDYRRAK